MPRPNRTIPTLAALASLALIAPLHSQTHDDARLTLGIAFGGIQGAQLWHIPDQLVVPSDNGARDSDIFDISKRVGSDISMSGQFTYFGSPHFGLTGEFTFMGLGAASSCRLAQDGGDADLQAACAALEGVQGSSAVTAVNAGFIVRPLSHTAIQPYIKGLGGVAFTPSSTIHTEGIYGAVGDTLLALTVYNDDGYAEVRPTWTVAAGLATAPSSGYQLRIEARETWIGFDVVTAGDPSGQGFVPPHRTMIKAFPSLLVGFDIVLERKRGHRY